MALAVAWFAVILKKNARLYYLKPPVLIFGVLFPVFFFLAFKMRRPIAAENVVPGMVARALWFTASAVGPLVTPWERSAKTYELLISTPVSLHAILAGDVISGFVFGACLSVVPIILGLVLLEIRSINGYPGYLNYIYIDLFFNEMANALADGDRVEIRGLCFFYVKKHKAYAGRNPKTGEPTRVKGKKLPIFKCGKELKERVDY